MVVPQVQVDVQHAVQERHVRVLQVPEIHLRWTTTARQGRSKGTGQGSALASHGKKGQQRRRSTVKSRFQERAG